MKQQKYHIAVVGATGAVGEQILHTLAEREFPIETLKLLSSKRSAGNSILFNGKLYVVEEATPDSFDGIDIAFFSAGGNVSKALVPEAVKRGVVCIDNTSAYRMDEGVPLVVPEVNDTDLAKHQGIVANPNCSTIQMVVALEPIRKQLGLKKVIVSTYQAVSGAGLAAVEEMQTQTRALLNNEKPEANVLPVGSAEKHYPIAFNAIPQIDVFQENGYTFEEMKMIQETKKIMHMPELEVAATCVRLPIETGHSESVYFETETPGKDVAEIRQLLTSAPGVTVQDDPSAQLYPMVTTSVGRKDVFVGRLRRDLDRENGYHAWVVSDNLLKGAAWNAVQIAESLVALNLVHKIGVQQ